MSLLDQLRQVTTVVADTADFALIKKYAAQNATTNPTLMSKGAQMPEYAHLLEEAVDRALETTADPAQQLEEVLLRLCVLFGREILQQVPGQVSSEVDVRHSYDTAKQVALGRRLIALYEAAGVPRDRVLVKMASTWEGICAAQALEAEGIHCNLTLLFSFAQAVACAEAGVTLISPFVARVGDWYRENRPDVQAEHSHPGVDMVVRIYRYYRRHGYSTVVMPASLRTPDEIKDLAGCDAMTMSPSLLDKLAADQSPLIRRLDPQSTAAHCQDDRLIMTEPLFRQLLERDPCATEKMAQAMQGFTEDTVKLEALVAEKLSQRRATLALADHLTVAGDAARPERRRPEGEAEPPSRRPRRD